MVYFIILQTITLLAIFIIHEIISNRRTHIMVCYTVYVAQVWCVVMEETERLIELVQSSTDRLVVNILEALTQITAEKKLVRKHYAEKRQSMDTELDRVCSRGGFVNADLFSCFLNVFSCSCDAKMPDI